MMAKLLGLAASALSPQQTVLPDHKIACPHLAGADTLIAEIKSKKIKFVVFGERHGTNEAPELFGDFICTAAKELVLSVSLELTQGATESVKRYIASQGAEADRQLLIREDLWNPNYADGRSSDAVFKLIERLRVLTAAGAQIVVNCIQPDFPTISPQDYYELAMAHRWGIIAAENQDAVQIIIVGTAHAALVDNVRLGFRPAASFLRPQDVISIGPSREGGKAWNLDISSEGKPVLGPVALPSGKPKERGIFLGRKRSTGFSGAYGIGVSPSPSPPWRSR